MKVEDVVEGLNRYVEDCRQLLNIKNKSFFVMRKNMQVNSSFKAYKSINETLYLVNRDSKEAVVDIVYSSRIVTGQDETAYDKADIDKTMEYFNGQDDISYKIILVHEPDYADTIVDKYSVNLILAGHSHNGQINIPYVKNYFLPYGSKKYYDNYYDVNGVPLYVSSGIGESRINFRLFNRPSINFYRINNIES